MKRLLLNPDLVLIENKMKELATDKPVFTQEKMLQERGLWNFSPKEGR